MPCAGLEPAKREVKPVGAASSAYTSVPLDLDPKPLIVAEEMNTTTRVEHFRNLVRGKKYDDILALAKKLVNEGSHMLDLCCAIVGEDEKGYISIDAGESRDARACADSGGFHRSRRGRRGAEANSGQGDHQFDQPGRWREAHVESAADGQALRRGGDRADHRRRRHGADRRQESRDRQAHLRTGDEEVRDSAAWT